MAGRVSGAFFLEDAMGKANQRMLLARLKKKRTEYLRKKWQRLSQMLLLKAEKEGKDEL